MCDTLDGRYSRMSGKGTPFGAFLDSTLDRIEEGVVLTAVAAHFSREGDDLAVAAVVVAVLASLMVSYTLVRAPRRWASSARWASPTAPVRVVILSAGLCSLGLDLLEPPSTCSPRCRPSPSSSASCTCGASSRGPAAATCNARVRGV